MSRDLITVRDLRVRLGDRPVLDGIDLDLERGRVSALVGLNGSGKTTLLRALIKDLPYEGRIEFHCGHDHRRPTPEHVGYVPQKLSIDARLPLTVRDLMALALQRRPLFLGISRRTNQQIEALLARVWRRDSLLDRPVVGISGGQLQRVLLALALQPRPELLLLDEPATGIDFHDQEEFYEVIARLNSEEGITILLVLHDLSVVSRYAQHVFCLNNGQIRCQGSPREVLTGEMLAETFGPSQGLFTHQPHGG